MLKNTYIILLLFSIFSITIKAQTQSIPLQMDTSGYKENQTKSPMAMAFSAAVTSSPTDTLPSVLGELSVNGQGGLNYTIAIDVIKGVNNFSPNLGLTYNSQSSDGIAGIGWSLLGLSSINVGGKSEEVDGVVRGVQFDGKDPYYLDGQRLLSDDNKNYTTQLFSKIKIEKLANNKEFIVRYPNGKIAWYTELVAGSYMITQISDSYNNRVYYDYLVESNKIYLTKISYGGTNKTDAPFFVSVNYKNTKVQLSKYYRGQKVTSSKVVDNIKIEYKNGSSLQLYRLYKLSYDYIHQDTKERLIQVDIENDKKEKLNPLKFKYNSSENTIVTHIESKNIGTPKTTFKIGSVSIGDFSGNGQLYPIYESIENEATEDKEKVTLWASNDKGSSSSYTKSRLLFNGKALVNRTLNGKTQSVVSKGDLLIQMGIDYADTNYGKDRFTLYFKDLSNQSGVDSDQKTIKFELTTLAKKAKEGVIYVDDRPKIRDDEYMDRDEIPIYPHNQDLVPDKENRRYLFGDFNNDGLVDLLIFQPNNYYASFGVYFCEIGKQQRNNQTIQLTNLKVSGDLVKDLGTKVFTIEFDGDGLPEFLFVNNSGKFSIAKLDIENKSLNVLNTPIKEFKGYTEKTPLVFGDFNGDGLTDIIYPKRVYDVESDGVNKVFNGIRDHQHLWYSYTSTGNNFIVKDKDFTKQRLVYINPSQKNVLRRYNTWDKVWSGKMDKYSYTEYGASNIMAMDVDGDGITDIVSFQKMGAIEYDLKSKNLLNAKLKDSEGTSLFDGIRVFQVKNDSNQDFSVKAQPLKGDVNLWGETTVSLYNTKISLFSFVYSRSDYNDLNKYKTGLVINDPVTKLETKYIFSQDNFLETQISEIDNNSGAKQVIEYRPLSEDYNTVQEKIYTYSDLNLPFPYYVHKANGMYYLVHKVNTKFDGKTLTKEYRYHNAIQHLQGKGFMGFQKTITSDIYESVQTDKGTHLLKDMYRGVFWTVEMKDPLMDNALVSSTYGSLDESNFLQKTLYTNKRFDKTKNRYFIETTKEEFVDYLNGFKSIKNFTFDTSVDILLTKSDTEYYSPNDNGQGYKLTGKITEEYTYTPEFKFGNEGGFFYGKFKSIKKTSTRGSDVFTSREENTYSAQGGVLVSKKFGNDAISALTTEYTYMPFGGIASEKTYSDNISPLVTSFTYDGTKRFVISTVAPNALKTSATYDIIGRVLTQKDALGRETKYIYDSWGNANTVIDYLKNKIITSKSTKDLVQGSKYSIEVSSNTGSQTFTYYDVLDRVLGTKTKSLNGKWVFTSTEYDVYGNVVRESQPYYQGETVKWNYTLYDRLNRPIEVVDYRGKSIKTEYEKNKVTVQDGHKKIAKWVDAQGLVLKTQDQGGVIENLYYANGSLKQSNYEGIFTKIEIDGWGNKTKLIDPSAGTYTYKYDNLSRLVQTTTPRGGKTIYEYDEVGNLKKEKTDGGSDEKTNIDIEYVYDKATQLPTEIKGNYNGAKFSYKTNYNQNQFYNIESIVETTPKFTYTKSFVYDKEGRVSQTKIATNVLGVSGIASSTIKNIYDKNSGGLLVEQRDITNDKAIWRLNEQTAFGASKKLTLGNGFVIDNQYDVNDYLTSIKQKYQSKIIVDIDYNYDAKRGTLSQRNSKLFGKNEQFTYDDLDRLLKETTNGSVINEYTYDFRGRVTSNTEVGKYNYNDTDYRLENINFNEKGSKMLQERGFVNVKYNAFKSPYELVLDKKTKIEYEFSILKSRFASYYGSLESKDKQPIQKYYSSDKAIEIVISKDKTQIISYITGDAYSANYIQINEVKSGAIETSPKNYYLHRDNLQSIIGISDINGNIVEQRFFDAWGNLKGAKIGGTDVKINQFGWASGLLLDRGYTGHEHLYTVGLIHMNGRIYDPQLRRFMSPDNFVQDNTNTQSYNRYGYVLNNPLLYTDPSGEIIPILIGIGVGIVMNGIMNSVNKVPFFYGAGKAGVMGGISGAIAFGIGSLVTNSIVQAGLHGVTSGAMSEIQGGKFITGLASGIVSSLISSGVEKLGKPTSNIKLNKQQLKATMLVAGGVSGGISSSIAGGDFWKGMQQGLITSGLNHVAHLITEQIEISKIDSRLKEKGYNPDDPAYDLFRDKSSKLVNEFAKKVLPEYYEAANGPELVITENLVTKGGQALDGQVQGSLISENGVYTYNGTIKINTTIFNTYRQTALTILHEFSHVIDIVSGARQKWFNAYGKEASLVITEVKAYELEQIWGGIINYNTTYLNFKKQFDDNNWSF
ncbi:RHS repeat-associated core domain-containing protein [Myroides odoratimimus]|uniref:RHS repeat-associated core domain-containing protein n=1 Tax=Myroides odoratimimus TaxID=76832 RepID=UPI00046A06F9|nr:RHS repeat-associated core domain-containing protein [Myroides odoratimimus]